MEHAESQPLRQLPVDLSEIDMIAEIRSAEMPDPMVGYLDMQTGEVHSVYLDASANRSGVTFPAPSHQRDGTKLLPSARLG
jgi:hypothetical protein